MVTKKREDTAAGCRTLAEDDQARAATAGSDHMRQILERSAQAWATRANMLERLETEFTERGHFARQQRQRSEGKKASG